MKRSRSNLSWLRKSMKKLKSFQMPSLPAPQPQIESTNLPNCQSTSSLPAPIDTNPEKGSLSHLSCGELAQNEDNGGSSENPDMFNVILQQSQQDMSENRPRQYGRRSNPIRISSMVAPEAVNRGQAAVNVTFHISLNITFCGFAHTCMRSLLTCGNLFSHFFRELSHITKNVRAVRRQQLLPQALPLT